MEDITDADYKHAKRLWEGFEIKHFVNMAICMFKAILLCYPIYLKILETNRFKYMYFAVLILFTVQSWQAALEKTEDLKLELLSDIGMLLCRS